MTHHFGAVRSDLDLLYDMTSGFIEVLQAASHLNWSVENCQAGMLGTDGKTFCPFKDASVIKEQRVLCHSIQFRGVLGCGDVPGSAHYSEVHHNGAFSNKDAWTDVRFKELNLRRCLLG